MDFFKVFQEKLQAKGDEIIKLDTEGIISRHVSTADLDKDLKEAVTKVTPPVMVETVTEQFRDVFAYAIKAGIMQGLDLCLSTMEEAAEEIKG